MKIHQNYKLAGVMGWPVAHSRSPTLHQHWIAEYGLHGAYVLLPVTPSHLGDAVRGLRALGFAGCNLTIPHKVAALSLVNRVDPLAQRIGAINTIVVESDGTLSGYNHDAYGFIQSLLEVQVGWTADAGPATVLGAGGASRAILVGLLERGAREIRLCNRSMDKAQTLANELGGPITVLPWDMRHEALQGIALLVNTTSLGMTGQDPLDLSLRDLPAKALVSDIVYTPLKTRLLAEAQQRGNPIVNGLGMLVNQARPAFASWFGVMPDVTPGLMQALNSTL